MPIETASDENPDVQPRCPQCESTRLRRHLVKSALWHGERLVLVKDIPAIVCEACGERFYDDTTATILDLMQGSGFPADRATEHLSVPVFSFSQRIPSGLAEDQE
ncbi:type II toxin-antitoxin system MqsA family antitoxin [Pseudaminobacter sp. NGMCC 1.201702]|uniref:type II toxin-antitoxin system MqsA family antitoxin n=1 Tax=Pseudaminobacter sp. NGMCC 1.201702 TaxID=3391825 RepID=UPI0039EFB49F